MAGYYILKDGEIAEVFDVMEWARWFERSASERRVALDEARGVKVSTVFLALDHSLGDGPPILFETMVFGGPHDEMQFRYATRPRRWPGTASPWCSRSRTRTARRRARVASTCCRSPCRGAGRSRSGRTCEEARHQPLGRLGDAGP